MRANVDGMPLASSDGASVSGGAFLLATRSSLSTRVHLGGWEIEMLEGSRFVVARGGGDPNYKAALASSLATVLRGLDYLAAHGVADLVVVKAAETHLVWTPGKSGPLVSVRDTVTLTFAVSATGLHINSQGTTVTTAAPPAAWHESMRYYRHAQLADDILDALRNLWLATENLLDTIEPQRAGEREGPWLRRALATAATKVHLPRYLPASTPTTDAYTYFYDHLRPHLFHAKANRQPSLPAEAATITPDLLQRHENLTGFYLALLAAHTGVSRVGGGATSETFEVVADLLTDGAVIDFSDDPAVERDPDGTVHPSTGQVISAPAARDLTLSRPGHLTLGAEAPATDFASLSTLRRLTLTHHGQIGIASALEGTLQIGDIETLRGLVSVNMNNAHEPGRFVAF